MSEAPKILVAGVGNIFFGDDAFGVEVAQRMLQRKSLDGATVIDFGIRGLDLTYALLDGCDAAIIVDAAPRGQVPGTVFVIEPDMSGDAPSTDDPPEMNLMIETHGMDPAKVLRLVSAMGGRCRQVLVVGCEPTPLENEDEMQMGLSPPVAAAVDRVIEVVESLISHIRHETCTLSSSQQGDVPCPP
jgi:hydrogenase maturation protease